MGGQIMDINTARSFFFWSTLINYVLLLVWFSFFVWAHDWMLRVHGRLFHLSPEQFDAMHYALMALFKVGIILLNLTPLIALCIVA